MPYVLETDRSDLYVSVAGLDETALGGVVAREPRTGQLVTIPDGARFLVWGYNGAQKSRTSIGGSLRETVGQVLTFSGPAHCRPQGTYFVDAATGKLAQPVFCALASEAVVRDSTGRYSKITDQNSKEYKILLEEGFQLERPARQTDDPFPPRKTVGGITYYRIYTNFDRAPLHQPIHTDVRPPYSPAYYVVAEDLTPSERAAHGLPASEPRSAKEIVKTVQDKIGVPADGVYGHKTNSKLREWAKARGISSVAFDTNGPRTLTAHIAALGLTSLAELEILGVVWDSWKGRGRSAEPIAPLPSRTAEQMTPEALLRQGVVSEGGFTGWVRRNYWWVIALAVVGVSGYVIWKRRREAESERPMLPTEIV